jgi:hypothetical protein
MPRTSASALPCPTAFAFAPRKRCAVRQMRRRQVRRTVLARVGRLPSPSGVFPLRVPPEGHAALPILPAARPSLFPDPSFPDATWGCFRTMAPSQLSQQCELRPNGVLLEVRRSLPLAKRCAGRWMRLGPARVLWRRGLTGVTPESARASHHRSRVLPASYARPSASWVYQAVRGGLAAAPENACATTRVVASSCSSLGRHRSFCRYLFLLPLPAGRPFASPGQPPPPPDVPAAREPSMIAKIRSPLSVKNHSFAVCVWSLPVLQSAPESSRTLLIPPPPGAARLFSCLYSPN